MIRFAPCASVAFSLVFVGAALAQSRPGSPGAPARGGEKGELIVFAASSLREVFAKLAEEFKRQHPGVEVTFNLAGSQELRVQIEQGAAADVFASADRRHMDAVKAGQWVAEDRIFARNEPVLAISSAGRAAIKSFEELPKAKRIVVAAPEVPIGGYTVQILERADRRYGGDFRREVEARIASKELNVRQVLAKVKLGEADAGIVYRTDVASAGAGVTALAIPGELNVVAEYPVAVLKAAPHPKLAEAWVELMTSPTGQRVFSDFGFLPATTSSAGRAP
jgi:molybdate transport system substrate-binding protein